MRMHAAGMAVRRCSSLNRYTAILSLYDAQADLPPQRAAATFPVKNDRLLVGLGISEMKIGGFEVTFPNQAGDI